MKEITNIWKDIMQCCSEITLWGTQRWN